MKRFVLGTLYWIVQLTWGLLMTILGIFATLFSIVFLKGKVHKNGFSIIVETGGYWGGVSLGAFALCGNYSKVSPYWFEHIRKHEFGHSLQNLLWGVLFPFVIAIPSAIRYWYSKRNPSLLGNWYNSIWFEKQANSWGESAIAWIERN